MRLNVRETTVPSDATIIVSGPPRSGTSLVAAALNAGGLWLGDNTDQAVFEDMQFAAPVDPHLDWRERGRMAWREKARWRSALAGIDVPTLRRLIAARDKRFARWGFKRPNMVPMLTADTRLSLFRHPRLILVFRDPIGFAERIAIAEGMRFHNALYYARRYTSANLRAAYSTRVPTLLVSYEKANAARESFFDELFAFCGMDVPRENYAAITASIDKAGKEYLRLASAPNRGYIDGYVGGKLMGWCRTPGFNQPETIDIYADDQKVASVRADGFSPDLEKAGFGDGRHRFSVPLEHLALPDTATIKAIISRTNIEIENSGMTLGALKAPNRPGQRR